MFFDFCSQLAAKKTKWGDSSIVWSLLFRGGVWGSSTFFTNNKEFARIYDPVLEG